MKPSIREDMGRVIRAPNGSEDMRKEFESELAKQVSGQRKRGGKTWVLVTFFAAILVCGAAAVTSVAAADQIRDQLKDQAQDGTGDNCVDDGVCDNDLDGDGECDNECTSDCDGDGICDYDLDGDGVCDNLEDCTCVA